MRGSEIYDGALILHSFGNLWFEYELLDRLPPDS